MSEQSLETQIGRMCFVGFEGLEPPAYLLDWIRAGRVGGIILFARNIASPQQVAALTDALQAAAPDGVLIGIDQEGGVVARLREAQGFTEVPGALALASAADSVHHVEQVAGVLAAELRAVGIHWDYYPVVDLSYNAANPSVGTRSYGSDPAQVSALAAAAVRGLQREGVAASPKHFPGLGNTPIDTHQGLPVLDTPLEHLEQMDLAPYHAVIAENAATIMVTHTIFTALDATLPATLSPVVVNQLLRGRLHFDGVVTTDCMEMKAISDRYPPGESAVLAALGGFDTILFSHTPARQEAAHDALLQAVQQGRVPRDLIDTANRRIMDFRRRYLKPRGDLGAIGNPRHRAIAREAAQAGVTLVKGGAAFPLAGNGSGVGVIEFPSVLESGIVEAGGVTGFARLFHQRLPQAEVLVWREGASHEALGLARRAGTLVLATRNAHLDTRQLAAAREYMAAAPQTILVALRNPYDAGVLEAADSIACTCGDAVPSLEAVVAALAGDYTPAGRLPVRI
ncbi:MAG: beta-N-acetylhexosaminidase [Anaerolineaceae bacterium]|nr:beta-N-acetylhexosaminidase [Anaerolineaceae bacterium]